MSAEQLLPKDPLKQYVLDLYTKRDKVETHLQSLKMRKTILTSSAEHIKQQVSVQYETIRKILNNDEQATLELIDNEKWVALGKIQKIVKELTNHLHEINQSIKTSQNAIDQEGGKLQSNKGQEGNQEQSREALEKSQRNPSQATNTHQSSLILLQHIRIC